MRVAVLAGGRSSEHEVSLNSAASVREGVAAAGHEVAAGDDRARAARGRHDGEALALRPGGGLLGADVVFPVLHGPFGEDGTVQGLLELLDVPYVGAGVLASSLCMDKVVFKEVLAAAGVPQVAYAGGARGALARRARRRARASWPCSALPVFVKPARLGSSVGIAKVVVGGRARRRRSTTAFAPRRAGDRRGVLAPGIEVECSVIGPRRARGLGARARSSCTGADWYDYEAKYAPGGDGAAWCPARLAGRGDRARCGGWRARRSCASAARAWRGSTSSSRTASACWSTSSTRCPGFTATSVFPKLWEASGRAVPGALRPAARRSALERYRARARGPRVLGSAVLLEAARISEISTRSGAGGELR